MSDYRECRNRDNCGGWLESHAQIESGLCENCMQERDDLARDDELATLRAKLAAAEARANELSAMLDHQRDEATEMERMLRAEYAKVEARADGWQPIETAPKDGTRVLISSRGVVQEAYWAMAWEDAPDEKCWWSTPHGPAGRGFTILPKAVTHWMPLPAPPDAALAEGEAG